MGRKTVPNEYSIVDDTVYMIVGHKVILFDKADLQKVTSRRWRMCNNYVITTINKNDKRYTVYLHRFIMGVADKELEVDHINGDQLDNRRCNLRVCTHADNRKNNKMYKSNTTGVTGVSYRADCPARPYVASICVGGKQKCLGYYPTIETATEARRKAEQMYFGDFTRGI